ncbi:anti-sigma factor family protein [Pedobacter xixiisoli]|uniref:Uncharacterized protein n=1 Tax=Pedobacter xixiisoli TaxID=1476464 RepID=A0A286ADQ3_9SPHI|nr:hypothetical protein [Pedobacter xixiisoli]SOD20029.1 hypothetical protein SAMN06297358_3738 [Pedobacter xixiisoli]
MTQQEEQLWSYIDGFSNDLERAEIEAKLATDAEFQQLYEALLEVNQQIATHLEIDEPSMSFTRNVMEKVQQEIAPVRLKTKVDARIIYAIVGFFALGLVSILTYAIATAVPNFTTKISTVNLANKFDGLLDPTVIGAFLFINAILLLVYLDSYLRKGMIKTQKKGEL